MFNTIKNILSKTNTVMIFHRYSTTTFDNVANNIQSSIIPEYNFETRLLRVAVVGVPNAGKSTFINNLMDRKVCATSAKVHTTRKKSMAVFTADDAQIVFVDTPGLINDMEKKRYNLEKSFVKDTKNVLREADIIGVIHDVTNMWTRERLDIKIIKLLEMHKTTPSFLVFNKVDALKSKRKLLDLTRQITDNCIDGKPIPGSNVFKKVDEFRGWPYFQEIFMVSALTGDGLSEVKKYLMKNAKPGQWMFPHEVWTDQSSEMIITNTVQAKFLDFLPQEIPYLLKPAIEYFNIDENDKISVVVIVNCPSARVAKLVAGDSDGRLKQITESVQQDLQDTFHTYVKIRIVLTPPKEK